MQLEKIETNIYSCQDSIVINVNPTYTSNSNSEICHGGSYSLPWGGSAIIAGDYSHTYL